MSNSRCDRMEEQIEGWQAESRDVSHGAAGQVPHQLWNYAQRSAVQRGMA